LPLAEFSKLGELIQSFLFVACRDPGVNCHSYSLHEHLLRGASLEKLFVKSATWSDLKLTKSLYPQAQMHFSLISNYWERRCRSFAGLLHFLPESHDLPKVSTV
jgi:hypothetical protein